MRPEIGRLTAIAAVTGGLAWFVKGTWTFITLDQPSLVYELGPPLFLVATWGLWSILPAETEGARGARAALVAATLLFLVAASIAILEHYDTARWEGLSSVASLLAMIIFLVALSWIGVLIRNTRSLPPTHGLPLGMAVALLPLLFLFGVAGIMLGGTWEERLIEVPIMLWGLGWMWIGKTLWDRS